MKKSNESFPFLSDRIRIMEILAVVLTGVGKIVFMDLLQWKLLFIVTAVICWTAYIIYRTRSTPHLLKYWGFRTDNLKQVTLRVLPFGIVSLVGFIIIGTYYHTTHLTWHIIPILILYPLWGTIQQFLVIALVAGNMQDLQKSPLSKSIIILLTALLFGFVHYPDYWLILGTFILALYYGYIYLKTRNLFVMGLFHGWLGAIFFYTVVNRDPFQEIFGIFMVIK